MNYLILFHCAVFYGILDRKNILLILNYLGIYLQVFLT
jgi:hypothetical protein